MNEKIDSILKLVESSDWVEYIKDFDVTHEQLIIVCRLMPNFDYQSSTLTAKRDKRYR